MTLAAIVLAAGSSTRFGGDKLSADFNGEPLVRHAIRAARAAPVARVAVVAHPSLDCGVWAGAPPVEVLRLTSAALSESLKAGIARVSGDPIAGVFVFLGDMPLIPHETARRLADMLGEAYAVVPRHEGKSGHPVLLSARAFPDIAGLGADEGAGRLLRSRDDVVFVDCDSPLVRLDIDRPRDLAQARRPVRSGIETITSTDRDSY
ncbi:molybdopterin-guanine dinucleotide biosynthesis protein MobA [Novosphingobium sp. PC22D]|uniref:nucleotidyltransferase family protein n=1 Tax=Novosphingobium sp. PC22D TaxID=1962403 RepID=UPI000BF07A66|nr:nucleotidyltransferase family protein [Novosphingobium sp. PC22D]PEQ14529.1 molybdopterin-guanine dinucleotide biosynthesis protein MobA [Novosphingobium sp. PC22D]